MHRPIFVPSSKSPLHSLHDVHHGFLIMQQCFVSLGVKTLIMSRKLSKYFFLQVRQTNNYNFWCPPCENALCQSRVIQW